MLRLAMEEKRGTGLGHNEAYLDLEAAVARSLGSASSLHPDLLALKSHVLVPYF